MFAKINHLAICTNDYATNARFYQALFGMKASNVQRPARAAPVGDGQIGLNNIPLRDGRRSGLDHFGFEVESIRLALERMKKFDPDLPYVERPSIRPNAAWSAADHDMIIYDLAERNSGKAADIFAENSGELPQRYINHVALRSRNPERSADFYSTVYELQVSNENEDGNYRLSDGRVTLLIMPWKMENFIGQDPEPPRLDHFGFKVESVETFKKDMDELIGFNPKMVTKPLGYGAEGKARLDVFKQCPIGEFQLTDIEGTYIDVTEH
ncbi:MAG TPA: VOC family protein [Xanthobacteraceae bacterium]|jgi:catechol 2,3-dioxygenase-like lactoylglutathione lyase family enzyme|nr:VOC family protein [Xanthobacteraceae bacterium]